MATLDVPALMRALSAAQFPPAARAWAEALRSRLDAFRNKARVQFPPLNESLGPNLSPRPELPPYPPASPARLKAGQVDVAG